MLLQKEPLRVITLGTLFHVWMQLCHAKSYVQYRLRAEPLTTPVPRAKKTIEPTR